MSDADTEVLLLTHELMADGFFWRREVVFGSDHQVFQRVSRMFDPVEGWEVKPWALVVSPYGGPAKWDSIDALKRVAEKKRKQGWQVEWHPKHGPISNEFYREAAGLPPCRWPRIRASPTTPCS